MNYYQNKRAIVVGGSEGIGLAVSEELAARRAHVLMSSRQADKLARGLRAMETRRKDAHQTLETLPMDVTDAASVSERLGSAIQRFGTPDLLINCAGFAHPGYLEDLDVSVLRRMMDVNYFGIVHTVKAVLPALQKARKGHIVNVSSMAGYLGLFGYTGYCASKYAVVGFSQALRHELKPFGITVSVVCPPNTRTPGFAKENLLKPPEVLKMEEKVPTVDPEIVARAMLRAIPRRTFLINTTPGSRIVYQASRWWPEFAADFFLRRSAKPPSV